MVPSAFIVNDSVILITMSEMSRKIGNDILIMCTFVQINIHIYYQNNSTINMLTIDIPCHTVFSIFRMYEGTLHEGGKNSITGTI